MCGWAVEAGADVVEANYSCPNVCSAEGQVYTDVALSETVTETIRSGMGELPLLLKIGCFRIRHCSGIFYEPSPVARTGSPGERHRARGAACRWPAGFGEQYLRAGVLGRIIHEPCVRAVREARAVIDAEGLPLALAAVGGVSSVQDYEDFMAAGADAVLCGSSPMYLPDLAVEIKAR